MVDRARAAAALGNLASLLSPNGQSAARYAAIRSNFLISLSQAASEFLEGADQRSTVNLAKRITVEAYGQAAEAAFGGEEPEGDDLRFLNTEVADELDFIEALWGDLKMQRKAGDTRLPAGRIEQYANSLDALFNELKARASRNLMLEMVGDDGAESCKDCQRYKGQRHRAKWWIEKGLIPGVPGNSNYECRGFQCQHYLQDDQGNRFTV